MDRYRITWTIHGTTEIDAETAEEASILFYEKGLHELAETGELEVEGGPETEEDRQRSEYEFQRAMEIIRSKRDADVPF